MSRCRSCGAEIIWIKTKRGKPMPCNAEPISYRPTFYDPEKKTMFFISTEGHVESGVPDPFSETKGYTSHFATCPNANNHRKRKKDG